MARQKKCVICNELIVDEEGVPYKGRFAHQKCFNNAIKTLQQDKSKQIQGADRWLSKEREVGKG